MTHESKKKLHKLIKHTLAELIGIQAAIIVFNELLSIDLQHLCGGSGGAKRNGEYIEMYSASVGIL
jgi:hypothetical protein